MLDADIEGNPLGTIDFGRVFAVPQTANALDYETLASPSGTKWKVQRGMDGETPALTCRPVVLRFGYASTERQSI